jgi:hypothetical protein
MTNQHPIAPPPELVQQWWDDFNGAFYEFEAITAKVFQAGADQELEACVEYLVRCAQWEPEDVAEFLATRQPKPPSPKEQALAALDSIETDNINTVSTFYESVNTIRRALEQLDD